MVADVSQRQIRTLLAPENMSTLVTVTTWMLGDFESCYLCCLGQVPVPRPAGRDPVCVAYELAAGLQPCQVVSPKVVKSCHRGVGVDAVGNGLGDLVDLTTIPHNPLTISTTHQLQVIPTQAVGLSPRTAPPAWGRSPACDGHQNLHTTLCWGASPGSRNESPTA